MMHAGTYPLGHDVPPILSTEEMRVVRLAAMPSERPGNARWSLRASLDRLGGHRQPRTLADPRLEALRSQAMAQRDGRAVIEPGFVAAGYTDEHSLEVARIIRATLRAQTPAARRSRAAHAGGITLALSSMLMFVGLTATLMVAH